MNNIFNFNPVKAKYNINNVLDQAKSKFSNEFKTANQIICDIDKTYLETEYDSFMKMAKIAFQNAEEKKNVIGAKFFFNILQSNLQSSNHIHFVSSSPSQLNKVFQEKFYLDAIDWNSLSLKNQVYNIKKIRFKLLNQQTAYKTLAIIKLLNKSKNNFFFIGDNDESDLYIYLGLYALVNKKISKSSYKEYLKTAEIDPSVIDKILQSIHISEKTTVKGIFIRNVLAHNQIEHPVIHNQVFFFNHYIELLIHFIDREIIDPIKFRPFLLKLHNHENISVKSIVEMLKQFTTNFTIEKKSTSQRILDEIKFFTKNLTEATDLSPPPKFIMNKKEDLINENLIMDFAKKWQASQKQKG